MKECKHEWEEDENFKDGTVKMFFGNIGSVQEEIRVVCKKCKEVDYIPKGSLFFKEKGALE